MIRNTIVVIALLASAACGGPTPASSTPASTPTGAATVLVAAVPKLGPIVVDGRGMSLYLFEADRSSSSTCYGSCAAYWPPLLTNGAPHAGPGASPALLGTTRRTDGSVQVTYHGHPLYYVVTDHNPGDTTGQGVDNFGALWYVLGGDGNKKTV